MCDKDGAVNPLELLSGGVNGNEKTSCDGSSWLGNLAGKDEPAGQADNIEDSGGYQELPHPPVIGKRTNLSETYDPQIRNRFLNELYLKYPSLLPKDIPKNRFYEYNINVKYLGQPTGVTTYRSDFGDMKVEDTPDLYTAAGLHKRAPPKKPYREPGLPYLNRERSPITDEQFPARKEPHVTTVEEMAKNQERLPQNKSEYNDNINGLGRYFYKKEIYTKPYVFITTKNTLPK